MSDDTKAHDDEAHEHDRATTLKLRLQMEIREDEATGIGRYCYLSDKSIGIIDAALKEAASMPLGMTFATTAVLSQRITDLENELRTQATVMRDLLKRYGTHTTDCSVHRCRCGFLRWMHDHAEDIDEETCIQQGQTFTPRPCDCGFGALAL